MPDSYEHIITIKKQIHLLNDFGFIVEGLQNAPFDAAIIILKGNVAINNTFRVMQFAKYAVAAFFVSVPVDHKDPLAVNGRLAVKYTKVNIDNDCLGIDLPYH